MRGGGGRARPRCRWPRRGSTIEKTTGRTADDKLMRSYRAGRRRRRARRRGRRQCGTRPRTIGQSLRRLSDVFCTWSPRQRDLLINCRRRRTVFDDVVDEFGRARSMTVGCRRSSHKHAVANNLSKCQAYVSVSVKTHGCRVPPGND